MMAHMTLAPLLLVLLLALSTMSHAAQLDVLVKPTYQTYATQMPMKLTDFQNLLLATNGLSIAKPVAWKGLTTSSFLTPKITLLFLVDSEDVGLTSLSNTTVLLEQDTDVDFAYLLTTVSKTSQSVQLFDDIPSVDDLVNSQKCQSNFVIDVITLPSHTSSQSMQTKIDNFVQQVNTSCALADTDLLVYVLSSDRRIKTGRIVKRASEVDNSIVNPAVFYSDQYPAMFNLIFWTSLLIGLAVIGISYSMCYMDPGLNTVIYRMTSQRLKKEQ